MYQAIYNYITVTVSVCVHMQALSVWCGRHWLLLVWCLPCLCQCGATSRAPPTTAPNMELWKCPRKSEKTLHYIVQGTPSTHRARWSTLTWVTQYRTLMIMFHFYFRHLCSQGHPQQAALGQALHQLRQAVSGEHNDCLEMLTLCMDVIPWNLVPYTYIQFGLSLVDILQSSHSNISSFSSK